MIFSLRIPGYQKNREVMKQERRGMRWCSSALVIILCIPAPAHLIQMSHYQASAELHRELINWITCAGTGTLVKHAGQQELGDEIHEKRNINLKIIKPEHLTFKLNVVYLSACSD